jgi:hypothetical protein
VLAARALVALTVVMAQSQAPSAVLTM